MKRFLIIILIFNIFLFSKKITYNTNKNILTLPKYLEYDFKTKKYIKKIKNFDFFKVKYIKLSLKNLNKLKLIVRYKW